MALAVQTKPRPQGSDPDTRKNSKLPKASVLHANTILTLDLQQEQSRRTGASSSVVEFSLVDDLRRPFPAISSSSSSSGSPPPLLLQTDVDLFGKFSVQVVDQSVEVLQTESAVKRSIKIQEFVHVQASSSSSSWLGPRLSFLLNHLLFVPTAWNRNITECWVCCLQLKVHTVWLVHMGLPGSLSLPATSS